MVTSTLSADNEEELEKLIERYMNNYHPAGYGTVVLRRWSQVEENDQMIYYATMSRGNTAD